MKQTSLPLKHKLKSYFNHFLLLFIILNSCSADSPKVKGQNKTSSVADSSPIEEVNKTDSIQIRYENLNLDTLYLEEQKVIKGQSYVFRTRTFSFNDSALVQEKKFYDPNNKQIINTHLFYYHNQGIELEVIKNKQVICKQIIHKNLFQKNMEEWEFKKARLHHIQFHHFKNGELFFSHTFMSADTQVVFDLMATIQDKPAAANQEIKIINRYLAWESKNSPELYDLTSFQINKNKEIGFISFSDQYQTNEHRDSLAIQTNMDPEYTGEPYFKEEYIVLDQKHRSLFLKQLKISENDSLFIYHYQKDKFLSFKIKNLKVVACVNVYAQGAQNEPDFKGFTQNDYMIGFEIDPIYMKQFGENYYQSFVSVGKSNPFLKNQVKPLVWKRVKVEEFPKGLSRSNDLICSRRVHSSDSTYASINQNYSYYVKDIYTNNGNYTSTLRRLIVIENQSKEIVLDELFEDGESDSPTPLNGMNFESASTPQQWSGKLFKNKPPVVFGFNYSSFGCPHISILDLSENSIYLNCDNRH